MDRTNDSPPLFMKTRLSAMFFMQFFVFGTTIPIISLYMKSFLGFSGSQIGIILATTSVSAFISPVIWAFIVDRVIRAERLLASSHILAAVCVFLLSFQDRFLPFFILYFLYMLFLGPTPALNNSIAFSHLYPKAQNAFGKIRLWGTLGWISVAWLFGFFWVRGGGDSAVASRLSDALIIASFGSVILALYALTLPKRPLISKKITGSIIPKDTFNVLLRKDILFLCISLFLLGVVDRFYFFGGSPYIDQMGVPDSAIMPVLSIGQMPELVGLGILGFLLGKFGYKKVLIIGAFFQFFRFTIMAFNPPLIGVIPAISVHGFCVAFVLIASSIYVDNHCDNTTRAGVHQLFNIANFGLGKLVGNLLSGWVADIFSKGDTILFSYFWGVAAGISILLIFNILFFFKESKPPSLQKQL